MLARHTMFGQFCRFAAVGACGTVTQYATLWIGSTLLSGPPVLFSTIGYVLGAIVNYTLNYLITFRVTHGHLHVAPKYVAFAFMGWCINGFLMWLFSVHWNWHYWYGQIVATGIGLGINFCVSRWWVFRARANRA